MEAKTYAIAGPILLTPKVFEDDRGFFFESWNARSFAAALGVSEAEAPIFMQDNHSRSSQGVLRGLHYQLQPEPQGKLVRCVAGEIFDVAVDIRGSSATFGQWVGERLSAENHQLLWIPPGFAHGFLTLSPSADVLYKASGLWSKTCERSLLWSDPAIAIAWLLGELSGVEPLLASKDASAPLLVDAEVFA
ncbi:dTDP-4-dehydrorhamnose 3,5-epimerase [Synechococcus sp. CS-602]|uniref:dTDP-4-dehydrorhamnose 3,5-epimerase n=1 Tax=Synechococcaceae TaxID=1890426 RepID=UPI0008FF60AD|nr:MULTISPECIES: dTDP-4-dehydrorhamnose 3,5-epimerase [Synechococcaceae]MCT4365445.1 dTDP-4-dehydrorhamnose 3,5-epimerase [Candidatus Regnicoccus frigidus MAG-AL1]APD47522.1 dTDP-4-dehydrorhamnose 3,5-epimerase [Synechococcus sp. SynAce01]MCT0202511.1 dTDP-4-dehydrorhamnose 3,5-epimerase [Synechococcus sp. CS-603]MCT0204315.1 dTDP-4-dehydrorhamnose 3,5-epimerase [Synechococcus sp. CS-602]MCT0247157.1 dTDP-4-dehydrorhamnose 3,5-epimerase [Synechococcus sp. CS-601]